ncbi:hypothetical protein [Rubripirellula reticaptiva]|nr:hypothetical protein [Rubripirellula reticaptiva]
MSKRTRNLKPERLPREPDFNPNGNDLDAACAWRNFGGLTLTDAIARFQENPLYYQEDFMFMGTDAFHYYFPVLDTYLRGTPDAESEDDNESWIIAHCIAAQFHERSMQRLRAITPAVLALADFVRDNIGRFGGDVAERDRVSLAWHDLASQVVELQQDGG